MQVQINKKLVDTATHQVLTQVYHDRWYTEKERERKGVSEGVRGEREKEREREKDVKYGIKQMICVYRQNFIPISHHVW